MKYLLLMTLMIVPATAQEVRPLTEHQVCATVWGKDARHVSAAMKRRVFERDGYPLGNKDPRGPFEIDHIVPRSLAGADTVANLQVQQYFGPWNAYKKDRLEGQAHRDVCAGKISLQEAQGWFIDDWKAAYERRFARTPGAGQRKDER